MSFPVWIAVGPLRVHPHLAFELLAYLVGIAIYQSARSRLGDHLGVAERWSLFAAAAVGAVVGSRALNWMEDPVATLRHLGDVMAMVGGQTVVGGLLGAWVAVEIQKHRLGIRVSTGDRLAVPAAAGIAVGRIGCFLSGLPDGTYGVATSLPWGVDLGDGIARHPTALYESLFLAVLALWLHHKPAEWPQGKTFRTFLGSYLGFRLLIDTIKPGVPLALGLTAIQWACICGLAYYARHATSQP